MVRFLNLKVLKYIPVSSKYFGSPKNELGNWEEVKEYVEKEKRNEKCWVLYQQQINIPPPIHTIGFAEKRAKLESRNFHYEEYVIKLDKARIYNSPYCVITQDDLLIKPLSEWVGHKAQSHQVYSKLFLPKTKKLKGKTLLFKSYGTGYFHIMIDAVPVIKMMNDIGLSIDDFDNILIPDYEDYWYDKVYAKIGVNRNKIITTKNNSFECEELFVASYIDRHGNWYGDFIKEKFLNKNNFSSPFGEKIFISRDKAKTRKFINEKEVIGLLTSHGFQVVFSEDFSIEEQAIIFNSAKYIISAHGANLVNLLFCSGGTNLCEIRYSNHNSNHKKTYYEMACNSQLNYYLLYCPKGVLEQKNNLQVFESDMIVPIPDLHEMLTAMGLKQIII